MAHKGSFVKVFVASLYDLNGPVLVVFTYGLYSSEGTDGLMEKEKSLVLCDINNNH